ncbi:MAG: hypothetical protein JWO10_876 [Microbacteriaceae bacterium]|nr:hypothetical protein [Microbacteriaceae bacterium]
MSIDPFPAAVALLNRSADQPAAFSQPFLDLIPVTGVAVSTIGDFLGNETVSASDPQAARLDEYQFDLSEGPCWDAMRTARPVLRPDLVADPGSSWPAFLDAIIDQNVRAIFAFPLIVGSLRIGAVDLYSLEPLALTDVQSRHASALASLAGRHILRHAIQTLGSDIDVADPGVGGGFPRRVIHQATGMVMAQMDLSAEDAALVIQGHAFAASQSMLEVARSILDRSLDLSSVDGNDALT